MDRQLLLALLVAILLCGGCNRSKAPPTAAATSHKQEAAPPEPPVEYRTKTTYDFQDDVVEGNLMKPDGAASDQFNPPGSAAPPASAVAGPGIADSSPAEPGDLEAAMQRQILIEQLRRQALAEGQQGATLGALGAAPQSDAARQPGSFPGLAGTAGNPLRGNGFGGEPPQPQSPNPLREARTAPSVPSIDLAPPPPSPPTYSPAFGGAAPPSDIAGELGIGDVQRFARMATSGGGGSSIEPRELGGGNPGAPTSAAPAPAPPPLPAPVAPAAVVPGEDSPYEVVQVFYGTDRQSAEPPPSDLSHVLRCFWPTVSVACIALCLAAVAVGRRSWLLALIAVGGLAVSGGLGYENTADALALIRGAGKQGPRYTTARATGGHVERGTCQVTLPKTHHVGELESPSVLRLEITEDAADHVVLQKTARLADAAFYDLLRQAVNQSARRELFVFVHGFNVSFEDAARRTAQIHYDLKFDGAPIFFSWPAHDRFILTYAADETNVAWSAPHLKQFLLEIVKESGAKSINLIAHSMGNRALAAALREIELEMHEQARLFNQVILAAPDIDADDFRNNIAPAMQRTAQRLTLYASTHDEALLASQFLHHGPRAGDAGDGLIVVNGIDTIDVTPIDRSLWGHSYYGSSNPVLHDLRLLLSRAVPPRDRTWLSPAERDGLTYWIFQPIRTASSEESSLK